MDKKKKNIKDLTMGAYQPTEKFKQMADGTLVRLEDHTNPKTVDPQIVEKEEHEQAQNEDESE